MFVVIEPSTHSLCSSEFCVQTSDGSMREPTQIAAGPTTLQAAVVPGDSFLTRKRRNRGSEEAQFLRLPGLLGSLREFVLVSVVSFCP